MKVKALMMKLKGLELKIRTVELKFRTRTFNFTAATSNFKELASKIRVSISIFSPSPSEIRTPVFQFRTPTSGFTVLTSKIFTVEIIPRHPTLRDCLCTKTNRPERVNSPAFVKGTTWAVTSNRGFRRSSSICSTRHCARPCDRSSGTWARPSGNGPQTH